MAIPLSATNVRLYTGVPFSPDQMNVRWFQTKTQQDSYFNSQNIVKNIIDNKTIKHTEELGIYELNVGEAIDTIQNVNYLSFNNTGKTYYMFVVYKQYLTKEVTTVYMKLDVMQTYMFDITIKPSYVIREHNIVDGNLQNNLIDEGIDYGDEYELISASEHELNQGVKFLVVACKQAMHQEYDGSGYVPAPNEVTSSFIGSPQPLTYYILPYEDNENGVEVSIDTGVTVLSKATDFLTSLYKSESATNNIVSIYVTNFTGLSYTVSSSGIRKRVSFSSFQDIKSVAVGESPEYAFCLYLEKIDEFFSLTIDTGSVDSGFSTVGEEKLKCYPYRKIVITDMRGNLAEYKPQYINNTNLRLNVFGSVGTHNKMSTSLLDYNIPNSMAENFKRKLALNNGFINSDPQDIPVVVDLLSAYMQGNRNSIENQKNQTIFNGVMNMTLQAMGTAGSMATINPINAITSTGTGINSMIQTFGNMQLQLESYNAKQQDIGNMPPSLASQGSNIMFSEGNKLDSLWVLKYEIKPEYRERLEAYFRTYGYKTNKVKQPILRNRTSWNYIQLGFANITGNVAGEALVEIKNIFMNGVFLWHVNDVGNLSLSNTYTT